MKVSAAGATDPGAVAGTQLARTGPSGPAMVVVGGLLVGAGALLRRVRRTRGAHE